MLSKDKIFFRCCPGDDDDRRKSRFYDPDGGCKFVINFVRIVSLANSFATLSLIRERKRGVFRKSKFSGKDTPSDLGCIAIKITRGRLRKMLQKTIANVEICQFS